MALTKKIIEAGRANNDNLSKESAKMQETIDMLYNFTSTDTNFRYFLTDTDLGKQLDLMLNKIIKSVNDYNEAMNRIAADTNSFLEEQQEINNRSI